MAVSATRSVTIPTWINEKNVFAAFNGLGINSPWEGWIKSASKVDRDPISDGMTACYVTSMVSYCLFATFSRIEFVLSPERITPYGWGYFPDPRGPYFYAALLLVVLNTAKIFKEFELNQPPPLEADNPFSRAPAHHQPPPALTTMDKFIVVVSNATPYLMIITNIAVTIIQIRRGDSAAWIKLTFIGITLIDITSWKPKKYRWYLDTILGYPLCAGALYYGNNNIRLNILYNLASSNKTIVNMVKKLENYVQNSVGYSAEEDEED
jgi:hypothetical protein